MSTILWKSFNLCFSKFKCFPTISLSPPPPTAIDEQDQDHKISTTTTTSPSILKNFNSLYDANYSSDISTSKSLTFSSTTTTAAATTDDLFLSSSSDSDDIESVPDFTSAFASHRFFFSSPGSSNSIIEPHPEPPPPQESGAVVSGGVAVQTYSPDPYSDFRKSMVEMIESRDLTDVRADNWGFLNELLLCYLTLNPKHTHKFIVGAFADVVVSLVLPAAEAVAAPSDDACRKTHLLRHCATSHLSI
ncbi:hypothetical protein DH2020_036016 [Rehmannia glutinosa]|uniref:Transcription repressor n=1 Tax=Rehmannia glutinosa TaxID=99300 RepID=A0ABR0V5I6_REHGL